MIKNYFNYDEDKMLEIIEAMYMTPQHQAEVVPLNKMIFFQNLALAPQHSDFIDHFKSECIAFENNEGIKKQREQLLLQHPPILSFHNEHQEKRFYAENSPKILK